MPVVLFAGGGTGGHLMPALAIADAMVALDRSIEPYFVGAQRGIEARVLPTRPWRHMLLPFEPIYRKQWWKNVRLPLSAWRSMQGLRGILAREQPVMAVGTGGYAAGPALYAAAARDIPIVLQEQNAFPGFATRRLAGKARQIHLGFPEARTHLQPGPATQVFESGNPIIKPDGRWQMADGGRRSAEARQMLGLDPTRPLVLVIGGSQGALAINKAVAEAIQQGSWPAEVQTIWQTGAGSFETFSHLSSALCHLQPFIDPIAPAYAAADLVVGRAGAMTLAELAAWGLPAILVPLPTAAADHQLGNARALAEAGAAVLLEQRNLAGASLSEAVRSLLGEPARMAQLASAAQRRARPNAASEIAREALRLLSKP